MDSLCFGAASPSTISLPSTSFSYICVNEPLPCQCFTSEEQIADLAIGIVLLNTSDQLSGLLTYLKVGRKSEMNDLRMNTIVQNPQRVLVKFEV